MHFSNFKTRAKSIGLFDVQVRTGKSVSEVGQSLERNPELMVPEGTISRYVGIHRAAAVGIGGHHKFATAQAQQVSSRMIRRNRTIDSAGGGLSALATLTCCKAAERATLPRGSSYNYKKNPYIRIKHLTNCWAKSIIEGLFWVTKGDRKCFASYSPRRTVPQWRS